MKRLHPLWALWFAMLFIGPLLVWVAVDLHSVNSSGHLPFAIWGGLGMTYVVIGLFGLTIEKVAVFRGESPELERLRKENQTLKDAIVMLKTED